MILQEVFKKYGYEDILALSDNSKCKLDVRSIVDPDQDSNELIGVYLSRKKDELFFLLDGNAMNINELCDKWDDLIRVFSIINGRNEAYYKIKYNIVQLIVTSDYSLKNERETDLSITRKLFLNGDMSDREHIVLDDEQLVELPFYNISSKTLKQNKVLLSQLNKLLPDDDKVSRVIRMPHEKQQNRIKDEVATKSYNEDDFNIITGWLEL